MYFGSLIVAFVCGGGEAAKKGEQALGSLRETNMERQARGVREGGMATGKGSSESTSGKDRQAASGGATDMRALREARAHNRILPGPAEGGTSG